MPTERATDSGIPVPVVASDDGSHDLGEPGGFPFTRGVRGDGYRSRLWTMRQYAGFASAEETNERFRLLLDRGQTGLSVAFDLPTQLGLDSDDPRAAGEVGPHRRRHRLAGGHGAAVRRDPARRGRLDVDDHQRPGLAAAPAVRPRRHRAGRRFERPPRHDPERHPQGVLRAGELHLPAPAVDAADHRHVPLRVGAAAAVQHDLDLRLPHPRGRLDGGAGARVHARERHRLRRGGDRGGPEGRRVRVAPLVLLQRAQRRVPGDRQVPRRPPAVGAHHARPVRRGGSAQPGAAVPRPDRRLDADRAAARGERRAGRAAGLLRRRGRLPVAAHERLRRGARAADRALRDARAAHPAGARLRGRHDRHRRSVRRLVLHRVPDRRAGAAGARADRGDRRHRRRRHGDRDRRGAGPDRGGGVRLPAGHRGRHGGRGRREPVPGPGRASSRSCTGSIRGSRRGRRSARGRCARAAIRPWRAPGSTRCAPRPARDRNLLEPMRDALEARCTIGEICEVLREEWGTYDALQAGRH